MSKQSLPDEQDRNTRVELVYQGMTNTFGKVRQFEQWKGCINIDELSPPQVEESLERIKRRIGIK